MAGGYLTLLTCVRSLGVGCGVWGRVDGGPGPLLRTHQFHRDYHHPAAAAAADVVVEMSGSRCGKYQGRGLASVPQQYLGKHPDVVDAAAADCCCCSCMRPAADFVVVVVAAGVGGPVVELLPLRQRRRRIRSRRMGRYNTAQTRQPTQQ